MTTKRTPNSLLKEVTALESVFKDSVSKMLDEDDVDGKELHVVLIAHYAFGLFRLLAGGLTKTPEVQLDLAVKALVGCYEVETAHRAGRLPHLPKV